MEEILGWECGAKAKVDHHSRHRSANSMYLGAIKQEILYLYV